MKKNKFILVTLFCFGFFISYYVHQLKVDFNANSFTKSTLKADKNNSQNIHAKIQNSHNANPGKNIKHGNNVNRNVASRSIAQVDPIPPVLQELLDKYEAFDKFTYNDQTFSISSDYQAIESKKYNENIHGAFLEEKYGLTLFKAKAEAQNYAVVISHLTHQVGILTGRILVKIENNNDKLLKIVQDEGLTLGLRHKYVNYQEVFVKPASKTFDINQLITKAGFTFTEIQIIEAELQRR